MFSTNSDNESVTFSTLKSDSAQCQVDCSGSDDLLLNPDVDLDSENDSEIPPDPKAQCHVDCSGTDSDKESVIFPALKPDSKSERPSKKYSCKFCEKMVGKISTHCGNCHKDEVEVARILTLPKNRIYRK